MRSVFPVIELLDPALCDPDGWSEIAAIMMNLDLVITVDTATAHLAGALGVPRWVPLSTISDWRWLLGRSDSPWYPTMRLYRQQNLGDWPPIFAAMATDLHALAKQEAGRLRTSGPGFATQPHD